MHAPLDLIAGSYAIYNAGLDLQSQETSLKMATVFSPLLEQACQGTVNHFNAIQSGVYNQSQEVGLCANTSDRLPWVYSRHTDSKRMLLLLPTREGVEDSKDMLTHAKPEKILTEEVNTPIIVMYSIDPRGSSQTHLSILEVVH